MNSGMVRRIDELGRIVIPKEIRKNLKLNMGDNVEIYIEDNKITLKKYSSLIGLEEDLFNIAKVINELTNATILFSDLDDIIVSYGKLSENYIDQNINTSLFDKLYHKVYLKANDLYLIDNHLENRNSYIFALSNKNNIQGLFIVIENDINITSSHLDTLILFKKFINKQLEK